MIIRSIKYFRLAIICALLLALNFGNTAQPATARGQDIPPAQVITYQLQPFLSGLNTPVYITSAHDGSNRLFIIEQGGRILVLQPGATAPTVFLDITSKVLSGGERGLLGLAFHPRFATNGQFYVDYTRRGDGATVIESYTVARSDPNAANVNSGSVLLTIAQPFANHNGGMLEFGPDGFLYIGMGDGGSANDPGNRAQNIEELLGKILRINVDSTSGSTPYTSPSSNPFFGNTPGRDEIYALGIRNPWRFSFDRVTGQLYLGDVGQNEREEIDIVTAGGNYGWRVLEGSRCTSLGPASCTASGFTGPIAEYDHSGGRCSVTGGYVYRGTQGTLPAGAYFFADFCTGEIFNLPTPGSRPVLLLDTNLSISSFGEDEAGEIYVVGIGGTISRLISNVPPPAQFGINSVIVRRRSSGEQLQPVTVKNNGKKFEVVINGFGFTAGATVLVNGRNMNVDEDSATSQLLVARLRRGTLSTPGPLVVEVVSADGRRSNQVTVQVVAE